jgi:NADH:ubiquinone oxidoreductase subunit
MPQMRPTAKNISTSMRLDKSFLNAWMIPATEKHRKFVQSIYPDAYFENGEIYKDKIARFPISERYWSASDSEAEYYAWMWTRQIIEDELMKRLES